MNCIDKSLRLIHEAAARHHIQMPNAESCKDLDVVLEHLLRKLEANIPDGALLVGGDLVIEASSAEVIGFMAEPDRVLLRFETFDVAVPDEAAHELHRQLFEKLPHNLPVLGD